MQLPNIASLYAIFLKHPSVQTDTRKLQEGDLFFALKGPSFNGNQFAVKALAMGAAFAIVDEQIPDNEPAVGSNVSLHVCGKEVRRGLFASQ